MGRRGAGYRGSVSDDPNPPRVLLVEGPDDLHVVLQLYLRTHEDTDFIIDDKGGVDPLLDSIPGEVKVDGRRVLGIVLDANEHITDRWADVASRLEEADITGVPDGPQPGGVCIEGSARLPRVGIWVMPDNTSPGELEDFVSRMVPDGDPVWPLSESYIEGIPAGIRKFTDKKAQRAKVYAWTATRKQPGRMGAAIKEGDLETDGELAMSFLGWLQRLFGELD